MILENQISIGFRGLTGFQWDLGDWSVTAWYQSLSTRIPRIRWDMGLDHVFIVHFDEFYV